MTDGNNIGKRALSRYLDFKHDTSFLIVFLGPKINHFISTSWSIIETIRFRTRPVVSQGYLLPEAEFGQYQPFNKLFSQLYYDKQSFTSMADLEFLRGGRQLQRCRKNVFPENCMKMKKFWLRRNGCVTLHRFTTVDNH